ncbi:(R)-2-hydroxyisocaproyl-CoA dehydratase beta subunit [bioreactor metagenome]|uniref:(R)-2-hydroxyisocaproyl-CoA dehydratase beta subunit n=1 Tax=bioreactor metagenome TaxID=1076179 RepID=A0A644Y0H0_9ZZZZ
MSKIDSIIKELSAVAGNPAKAIEDFKKETGKGAVGILPVYSPEEIVHAAGYLPVGIWGGQVQISKARTYFPPFTCSIMQTIMEMSLDGVYDNLDAVIFSVPCDTLKCFSQKWKGKSPVIVFTHPQNRKIEAATTFLRREYLLVKEKLEKILGVTITDEAMENSIRVYNENRQAMREFCELAATHPSIIDPVVRHAVIKSRYFLEKSKHTALVSQLNAELAALPAENWTGKKVILTGIMAEPNELLEIFKSNGIAVVADDLAQESRQFRVDVPENIDPLYRLAKWWEVFDGCCLATNPDKPRGQMLIDMKEKYGADAVVVCMMKFCDPEEFDYPIYYMQFQEAGVRSLYLEIDLEATAFEQIRTRVQSFCEIL